MCRAVLAASTAGLVRRSARALRPAAPRPAAHPTRTSRTTRHPPRPTPRTRRACVPRRRTSPRTAAPAPTPAARRSRRASAAARRARAGALARSTSAPTASCSRTTRATWPPWWTSTSRARSRSTSPRRACPWCRATCPPHSSTRRRRRAWAAWAPWGAWSCTSTTRGTSTTAATRRRATPPSTTRRTCTTTCTLACCCRAPRCTRSTNPWSGNSTRRTWTPPPARPTPTPPCPVWRRKCRTLPRTCTGSEGGAPAGTAANDSAGSRRASSHRAAPLGAVIASRAMCSDTGTLGHSDTRDVSCAIQKRS